MIPQPTKVLQLNAARSNTRMHGILNDNDYNEFDIILFQEPWYGRIGLDRSSTSTAGEPIYGSIANPAWDGFIPSSASPNNPARVATYVRKSSRFVARPRPDIVESSDVLSVSLQWENTSIIIINVYNPGPGRKATAVHSLTEVALDPSLPTAVVGDFNLHHAAWSLNDRHGWGPSCAAADKLIEWLASNALTLENDTQIPTRIGRTNQQDSILDLTFWNHAATENDLFSDWDCRPDLALRSDHNAITWSIHVEGEDNHNLTREPDTRYHIDASRQSEWRQEYLDAIKDNPTITFTSPVEVIAATEAIMKACDQATAATMPMRTAHSPDKAQWWNDDCAIALRQLRSSHNLDRPRARARFRATVRKAKRDWATNVIIDTPQKRIWGLTKWFAGKRTTQTPPIRTPLGLATEPEDQCRAFADAFFPRQIPNVERIQQNDPPARPTRPLHPITRQEIEDALADTSNTSAPGPSGIGYRLIKWAVGETPDLFVQLFNACLLHGTHPPQLKSATIAIIAKPRKADKSNPRAYRPIALLECVSKLLEKVIASRIAFEVGKYDLVPTTQFGGRPKSSVIDACLSLTHDVQAAWKNGLSASALAIDIKGYFDNVHHDRLVHTLRLLGFAPEITNWLQSFLADRSVIVRVDNHKSQPIPIAGVGIPQGSPISPILSTIYTSFALSALDTMPNVSLRAYVDDQLILATGASIEQNATRLTEAFNAVQRRLIDLGLSIDFDKSELIHFTRARVDPLAMPAVDLHPPQGPPVQVQPSGVIRWLGIFFDRKLNFKSHVQTMAARARSTIAGLRILANTIRGLSIANARILYKTVVLPVLTFGAEVWFTGRKQKALVDTLSRAQNEGLRWILGAFRTSPSPALHHLTSILPIPHLLHQISARAAIRIHTLPTTSQIHPRLPASWNLQTSDPPVLLPPPLYASSRSPPTIIHHLASLTSPQAERTFPFHTPPWLRHHPWGDRLTIITPPSQISKADVDKYARDLKSHIAELDRKPNALTIYTDGSKRRSNGRRRTGAGYTAYFQGAEVRSGRWGLGRRADNFDAEMYALAGASAAATDWHRLHPQTKIVTIFADNQAAIRTIVDTDQHPAQLASIIFRKRIDDMLQADADTRVEIRWIPGHKGFAGNERADIIAKAAVNDPSIIHSTITWAREKAKRRALKAWRSEWTALPHTNQAAVALRHSLPTLRLNKSLREMDASRDVQSRVIQVITGHGHIGDYYARFVPAEPTSCPCGEPIQTREHILADCELYNAQRHTLHKACPSLTSATILSTRKGLNALVHFLKASDAFKKAKAELQSQIPTRSDDRESSPI
jgi:ribonuclease HI